MKCVVYFVEDGPSDKLKLKRRNGYAGSFNIGRICNLNETSRLVLDLRQFQYLLPHHIS